MKTASDCPKCGRKLSLARNGTQDGSEGYSMFVCYGCREAHKKAAPKGGARSKHIRADDFDTNDKPGGASMTHADIHSKRGSHD